MTRSVTPPRTVRALDPAEADLALTVLTRHALTILAEAAPVTVTLANGPLVLEITCDDPAAPHATPAAAEPAPAAPAVPAPPAPAEPARDTTVTLVAETVGVFYRAPEPGAEPFVSEGDPVRVGQQVGIVEAMKLMIPVIATREGRVAEFLVENGEAVEYGAALLALEVVA